jgi:ring-1,2-phenylacetyl-CoA epoxidase subunit PaaD
VVSATIDEGRVDRATPESARVARAWQVLDAVPDPELPALSVRELGMVREVRESAGMLEVVLTPTYSGCPATEVIERRVGEALDAAGLGPARVIRRQAPPWTTDWISDDGRRKLRESGIGPPGAAGVSSHRQVVLCPRCGSAHTERLSAFGSTACKALYRCVACREPFEQVKPI